MSRSNSNTSVETATASGSAGNTASTVGDKSNTNIRRGTNVRGLLIDDTWHCDCNPRLAAVHFQTKNGGRHHGRWFYTCQKPQHKRCGFFLWDDDARARETMTGGVRSTNSTSEVHKDPDWEYDLSAPKTPSKKKTADFSRNDNGLLTPETGRKRWRDTDGSDSVRAWESPTKIRRNEEYVQDEDPFVSSEGLDEELASGNFDRGSVLRQEKPDSRRVVVAATPKQLNSQSRNDSYRSTAPPASTQPEPASCPHLSQGERYPSTPTPARFRSTPLTQTKQSQSRGSAADAYPQCPLVSETLALLESHRIYLPSDAKDDLVNLLNTHDLRTKGIIRGRDISRIAIKKKEEHIQELTGRIEVLETEREAWRSYSRNDKAIKKEPG